MDSELKYAHGGGDCPTALAEKGDALRVWVNESDFWKLRMLGVDFVETGYGPVHTAVGVN